MGELGTKQESRNVNVTLAPFDGPLVILNAKEFPCPLCGAGLPILNSKRGKPYFICNDCGVQIFVRGKAGIARLRRMAASGSLISSAEGSGAYAVALVKRLETLKLQKHGLENKQGIIFKNENVQNAISVIDAEIETLESELAKMAGNNKDAKK